MNYQTILYSSSAGVARITLNRPERMNSFTQLMQEELRAAIVKVATNGSRVLVITGAGRGFCAGQDLNDRAVDPVRPLIWANRLRKIMRRWSSLCVRCRCQ